MGVSIIEGDHNVNAKATPEAPSADRLEEQKTTGNRQARKTGLRSGLRRGR